MDNLLSLVMEAHSPERNHHRQYQVRIGKDLFDHWTARFTYGRVGSRGTECCYDSHDPNQLMRIVHQKLLRRMSAPKRIGCPYLVTSASETEIAKLQNWIPELILK